MSLGRFTQLGPSEQENSTYLYAGGDPVNRTDPSGLLSLDEVGKWYGRVNDVQDGLEMMQAIGDGEYRKAFSKGMGIFAGGAASAICGTGVAPYQ
ncbi:hypothetical protein [Streptomyces coeruleofuscus]|uniref:hypothetical protein n=1 Tax=Streptomyces coeruleofuscus TaxID=66879 RepID=UPI000A37E0FC